MSRDAPAKQPAHRPSDDYGEHMLRDGPIPRFVHGILEYAMGALFIAAPFLFEFNSSAATGMSVAVGVLILIFAAASEGPVSLVNQLPVLLHVTLLYLLSIFLVAAPFLLGFSDEVAPRNFFIISGVFLLLITIGTRFRRSERTDRSSAAKPAAAATADKKSARPATTAEPARPPNTGPAVAAPMPANRGVPPPSSYPPVPGVGPPGPASNQPPGYPPPGYPPQQPPGSPGQPPYGEPFGGQRPGQ